MRDKVLKAIEIYAEGGTIKAARAALNLKGSDFYACLRANPDIDAQYREVQRSRADMMIDEAYDISTDKDGDPRIMRVQADVRVKIAGLYDRQRFGEKIDLTVHNHVDLSAALLEARNRALPQPLRNLENVTDAEFVALPGISDSGAADKQSAAPEPPTSPAVDIFEE